MDFSRALVRCSALAVLFTEPQSKAEKEAGELSKTAKAYLNEMYIQEYWGLEKDITTAAMDKGIECEDDAITMISFLDDKLYEKNKERKANLWINGHADVVDEVIHDIKCSWSPWTFITKLTEPVDKSYFYQVHGYMWLYEKDAALLRYCLTNTPAWILEGEKRKLLYSMNAATDLNPEYMEAVAKLERQHNFDHIHVRERVITQRIDRNQEIIDQIPGKVSKAREYLKYLHSLHTGS